MRDRIKEKKYFDVYIEEDIERIKRFQKILDSEELSEDRISQLSHAILNIKIGVLIAKYSRGDEIKELVDGYKELLTQASELWHPETWLYSDELDLISIGKLFRLDDLVKETYMPLLESANINDWLYNFILFEKNTDAPLLFSKYKWLQEVVNAEGTERITLLRDYLSKKWYKGHSGEGWYDTHNHPDHIYCGYWSWEAGAVAKILGLNDESLKDQQYYPYDLVHFNGK